MNATGQRLLELTSLKKALKNISERDAMGKWKSIRYIVYITTLAAFGKRGGSESLLVQRQYPRTGTHLFNHARSSLQRQNVSVREDALNFEGGMVLWLSMGHPPSHSPSVAVFSTVACSHLPCSPFSSYCC
ncbi:hypothetical protein DPMN_050375 [Dreissena polymorpha]|uniref:Uncharacterized protein n=1 Tax=Dreissena polymorpha TaxID=45954 RepID=A0A9D4HN03_DREPO|nr:hypothetical protein DPMN_050375 [Dreissena polymorpha]